MYFDILMLRVLADSERHGYEIKKQVERILGGRSINNNVLYPALRIASVVLFAVLFLAPVFLQQIHDCALVLTVAAAVGAVAAACNHGVSASDAGFAQGGRHGRRHHSAVASQRADQAVPTGER